MKQDQRGVLLLVKSALTGEKLSLPADFDLAAAFALAKKHGITTLLYYGAHNCGGDAAVLQAQFPRVLAEVAVCEKQMAEIRRLTDAFDARNIEYMPLKGIGLRPLYPKPEMRRMGDADILIRYAQYGEIRGVMAELGYEEKEETDHELCWEKTPVYIELHKRLMGEDNKDFKAYFGDGWNLAETSAEGGCRFGMRPDAEAVYLFAHFAKHYRNGGVGLRPLLDLWLYFAAHPEIDGARLKDELEKLHLYTFYENVMRLLQVWFGDGESDEMTDFITDVIFESEEYGAMRMRTVSGALRDRKGGGSVSTFVLARIFRSVFVPFGDMCAVYPVLCKVPILLPIFWVVHFFRRAAKKGKVKHFVENYLPTGEKEVSEYQKSLQYVGLDYFF